MDTNKLTADTIIARQIEQLEAEAIAAGGDEMVDVCQLALKQRRNGQWEAGDVAASRTCADAINNARAQSE